MTAKLELKTASGGQVILDPTDTAVDRVLTLPAVAGTVLNTASDIEAQVKTATSATGSAPIFSCRAWVNFNGTGTVAIRGSGNVSSITDLGTGMYRVNFTTTLPDANYSAVSSGTNSDADSSYSLDIIADNLQTSSFRVTSAGSANNLLDCANIFAAVFR